MFFEIRIFSMNYYIGRKKLPRYFACIYLISDIFWFPLFLFRLMFFILPQSRAIRFLFRIRELKSPRNSKVGWVECKAFFSFCKTFALIHLKLVWMCFFFYLATGFSNPANFFHSFSWIFTFLCHRNEQQGMASRHSRAGESKTEFRPWHRMSLPELSPH